ncbi:COG1579 Zn-ribbon protein, possibly nucleic acid-binding [actinobacterium SCGC AAA044-D11]
MKASVSDQNNLIELQRIDSAIMQATHKLKALPEREQLTAIIARLAASDELLKVAEAELADVTIDLRRSEVDVESVADRMAKDESRMSSGSASPKELEQLQHEIATLAKRKAELEDGELEIMMSVDAAKEKVAVIKSDEEGLKKLELEINIRLENAVTELDREIALKKSERTLLAPKIDAALIELYEKIKTNGGVGAALLIGNTCDGCRLAINAVEMERIKSLEADELLRCEECRRILVRI